MLFGLDPLNVYDAAATPIAGAFAKRAGEHRSKVTLEKNPGKAVSLVLPLDGPESEAIPDQRR
ncbi:hypothetical protein WPS_11270 [Vulcanimicrobium alpinum]|uniref:Uncharacterized protein n=1 Tax=Vulcanimicrobium alpinum TaxID=3016050 RepID=A0AAN1XUT9_UNVUL|nr:hypothetical protein WPS_11270 [Vulcanimicrobium alpinum]